ncbi:MAG TPA: bifunctional nuclease family protein [Firmicutes bacterium]|nr:bifunctional nuclease family protein [Bacillota bacterium]
MIEMKVNGLAIDSTTRMPVVILTDKDEKRFLPIWIGVYEADAILVALEHIDVPRPMTHDLIKGIVSALDVTAERVVIHDIKKNTFFARVLLKKGKENFEVDSRPSDAIALALRLNAPIFVTENVIMEATIMDKEKAAREMEEFKDFLKDVKPEDFLK